MPERSDRVGEYILERRLAVGSLGEVWWARHHTFVGDRVVMKFPSDPTVWALLRAQGERLLRLDAPHIAQVLAIDADADPPFLTMEFVPGRDLRAWLQRRAPLDVGGAAAICDQVLDALARAHAEGILHGDIKPENVLVVDDEAGAPTVKVTDFGLAPPQGPVETPIPSGRLAGVGTEHYTAPEVLRGEPATARADVYSVGVLLYELVVGRLPRGAFPFPSALRHDTPAELDAVLAHALASEPSHRYETPQQFRVDLEAIRSGLPLVYAVPFAPSTSAGPAYRFPNGHVVHDLDGFLRVAEARRDMALGEVCAGRVEGWLRELGETDLAVTSEQLRREEPRREVCFQRFLEATGRFPAPRLVPDPASLRVSLRQGDRRRERVYLTTLGSGVVYGQARVEPASTWVQVVGGKIEGRDVPVTLEFPADRLAVGEEASADLCCDTNAGRTVIPLRVTCLPRPARLFLDRPRLDILVGEGPQEIRYLLHNTGDEPLEATVESDVSWLEAPSGVLRVERSETLRVRVHPERVDPDQVRRRLGSLATTLGHLILDTNDGRRRIPVRLFLQPRARPTPILLGGACGLLPWVGEFLFVLSLPTAWLDYRAAHSLLTPPDLRIELAQRLRTVGRFLGGLATGMLLRWGALAMGWWHL